ncbi:MAG: hypothetical protein M1832_003966 [Thelocarpon impressellum]|nr:MAG: hypothetical protein M1832_003966 [Thelocarpon impressellum]
MTRYSLINYLRCQLNAVDCPDPVKAKPTATLDAEARSSIERARGAGYPTDALLPSPGATISPPASLAKVGDVISSATVNYTVGPDGFTYSYPSLYVNFGNVSATDECGYVVGNTHSSVTLAFAPGELSTIMAMGLGGWIVTATRRIDVGNLTTSARPQIAFPTKLKEIDPAWKSCSANLWQGLDPPIALTRQAGMTSPLKVLIPVAALDPATTSAAPAMQGTLAATPNSFPELPAQQTSLPQTTSVRTLAKGDSSGAPGAGPAVAPVDPKAPAPIDPPAEVQSGSDLPKVNEPPVLDYVSQPGPSQPPKRGPAESQGQPRPLRQGESLEPSFNPGQYNIQAPAVIVQGQTISEDSPATVVAGNTVAVSSGSIYVGSQAAPLPTAAFPERQSPGSYPAPVVVGGLTFSFSPAGPRTAASPAVAVAGQEVVPAVESATVAGQAVSIAPGGGIVIGGSTPLTPGAAALTVSGTPVSLNPSALVIGSSTVPLPTPAAPAAAVFTFAGQVVTANPTVVPIAPGTTLYPGGPAVTISGVALSLGPSGRLVIGSTTLRLSSASTTVTSSRGSSLSTPLSSSSSLSTSEPPPPKKGAASSVTMRLSWLDTCWWGVLLALWAVWL